MTKRDDDIPANSLADLIRQIADSQDEPTLAELSGFAPHFNLSRSVTHWFC